jgi:hypothetical protein
MRFVSHAKFAAKAKMGVRAALKLDLRPAEEDRQALLKCLRKWLGEAKAGASGVQGMGIGPEVGLAQRLTHHMCMQHWTCRPWTATTMR